jgi:hypothetical protein
MRTRKLLARVLVPAALAFTVLGPTAGEATAMPLCWSLNYNYEKYEQSMEYWYGRSAKATSSWERDEFVATAQYFNTLRVATAQAIMQNNC